MFSVFSRVSTTPLNVKFRKEKYSAALFLKSISLYLQATCVFNSRSRSFCTGCLSKIWMLKYYKYGVKTLKKINIYSF